MPKMMALTCEVGGHEWQRPAQRGRPPRFCPKHLPSKQAPRAPRAPSTPKKIKPAQTVAPNIPAPQVSPVKALGPSLLAELPNPLGPISKTGLPPGGLRMGDPIRPYAMGQRDKGSIRPRELIHVSDVHVGDWTHYSGFRPVFEVKIYPRKKQVKLTWYGGDSETFDFEHKGDDDLPTPTMVRVLRKENL